MPIIVPQAGAAIHPVTIDKIVAVVNNAVITQNELDKRVALLMRRLATRHVALPPRRLLARKVLNQMVLQRLELQYAKRLGIRISRTQLRHAEKSLAARNHMTLAQFKEAVARQGLSPRGFRRRLRVELTIRELVERRISRSVTVSRRAVNRFLARARAADGARYRLSEITLAVPATASQARRQKVRRRAQAILAKIRAGEPFSQAAIAYSEDPHALEGGSLGWRTAARLPARFVRAVRTMTVGQMRLLAGHAAYYLIKLRGKKAGAAGPVRTEVRLREIVLRPSKFLSSSTLREKLKALKARIIHGQRFATVARAYSEGPSALRGGSLGWVSLNELPPALAEAANKLPLHAIGGPYAIPQGQALIEVMGRRQRSGMTSEEARRLLRMRRGSALYVRWLQTLRDDAYVRYPGGHG